jgi:hypothetical protein
MIHECGMLVSISLARLLLFSLYTQTFLSSLKFGSLCVLGDGSLERLESFRVRLAQQTVFCPNERKG